MVHLFAVIDSSSLDELKMKILRLTEVRTNDKYQHTITPNISNPQTFTMYESLSDDPKLEKINLSHGPIYLWRNQYSVKYGSTYIPVIDSDRSDLIPGEYIHRIVLTTTSVNSVLYNIYILYKNMLSIIDRSTNDYLPFQNSYTVAVPAVPAAQQTQIPRFVLDALKRDAINANYECPITAAPLANIQASITSCYHIFDRDSLIEVLKKSSDCPMCRQRVTFTQPI